MSEEGHRVGKQFVGTRKLKVEDVRDILRARPPDDVNPGRGRCDLSKRLADHFQVNESAIIRVWRRECWAWVKLSEEDRLEEE